MKKLHWATWLAVGIVGLVALVGLYPRLFPLAPTDWTISRPEAINIALERFYDLGEPVEDPYVVVQLAGSSAFEWYALETATPEHLAEWRRSRPAQDVTFWRVRVYAPQSKPGEWTYQAAIGLDGRVLELAHQLDEDNEADEDGSIDLATAEALGEEFLLRQGFDLTKLGVPIERLQTVVNRLERTLRYESLESTNGEASPYGVEVTLADERVLGVRTWFDNPLQDEFAARVQPAVLLGNAKFLFTILSLVLVAPLFIRRYHLGEIGVGRGLRIMLVLGGMLFTLALMTLGASSEGTSFGNVLSRRWTTWLVALQFMIIFYLPIAVATFLSWGVGESICRERWGHKLAAFDSMMKGMWANRTVASSMFRGTMAGLGLIGLLFLGQLGVVAVGGKTLFNFNMGPFYEGSFFPGIAIVLLIVGFALQMELYGRLLAVAILSRPLGKVFGAVAAALFATVFFFSSGVGVVPLLPSLALAFVIQLALVCLFLRFDLLTSLLASVVSGLVLSAYPWLLAEDVWVQVQGVIPALLAFVPMLATVRYLGSERRFEYRYDDIPPHVRRIADRERQRVELDTARNIQASILPQLPPRLNGVDLSHAYIPATEVGGDFYDVLALEDGRLAMAVGDVAGHGVSSGLVMSMAKSALAVQVTFDPRVRSVFGTLNRMVYQSARKRMLTTLVYAVMDPQTGETEYASAGHLFPYRIKGNGDVIALESVAYPLGVREVIDVTVRSEKLDPGDILFLYSDGVVEGRAEGSDDLFGFERLQESLKRHAGGGVDALRNGVLEDLREFTKNGPQEDDVTILVAKVA